MVCRPLVLCLSLLLSRPMWAQTEPSTAQAPPSAGAAPALTLDDAIRLAKANAPQFRAALADAGVAREDRVQARAALLPGVSYTAGAIYTKPNGTSSGAFVAANGVREYISQGVVHESLSFTSVADFRRAHELEALARANSEIATRGLVATVVQSFYGVIVAERKYQNAQSAADEANRFLKLSRQLETGGEVAHSDVIKAQLQANERERDSEDMQLAADQAKLGLAVLIFPSFTPDYNLVNDLEQPPNLPELATVQQLAETSGCSHASLAARAYGCNRWSSPVHFFRLLLRYRCQSICSPNGRIQESRLSGSRDPKPAHLRVGSGSEQGETGADASRGGPRRTERGAKTSRGEPSHLLQ
jgi:outer membrane protein TolC